MASIENTFLLILFNDIVTTIYNFLDENNFSNENLHFCFESTLKKNKFIILFIYKSSFNRFFIDF